MSSSPVWFWGLSELTALQQKSICLSFLEKTTSRFKPSTCLLPSHSVIVPMIKVAIHSLVHFLYTSSTPMCLYSKGLFGHFEASAVTINTSLGWNKSLENDARQHSIHSDHFKHFISQERQRVRAHCTPAVPPCWSPHVWGRRWRFSGRIICNW